MKEGKELYKQAELPAGMDVEPCPVCGADAELWQYSTDFKNGPIDKLMMCSNGDRFGPQDGAVIARQALEPHNALAQADAACGVSPGAMGCAATEWREKE